MMIPGWIARILAALSQKIVMIGAAIAGIAFLIMGHKYKVGKASRKGEQAGKKEIQERINLETRTKTLDIKEKAVEIKNKIHRDTADLDDLRRRMRESAKADRSNQ